MKLYIPISKNEIDLYATPLTSISSATKMPHRDHGSMRAFRPKHQCPSRATSQAWPSPNGDTVARSKLAQTGPTPSTRDNLWHDESASIRLGHHSVQGGVG